MTQPMLVLVGGFAVLTLTACTSTPPTPSGGTTAQTSPSETTTEPTSGTAAAEPAGTEPQTTPGAETQVTGAVRYRERVALTSEAVVHIEVMELTAEGSVGAVIGEQTLRNPGQVPIPFRVSIPSERIRPETRYVVRARITDGGRVFSTTDPVPVLTQGSASSDVQVLLRSGG